MPEGLHKQPLNRTADWIAANGFNCVRLTYSIDMALNPGLRVEDSFRAAAANAKVKEDAMMSIYRAVVEKNPFLKSATVRDVFAEVIRELWARGVMTVLDNHVSKASWCCNLDDGNGWWKDAPIYWSANSRYFNSEQWLAGLRAMAVWSRDQEGVVAMSLRNELRATWTQILFAANTWYDKIPPAARLIHEANPDVLVVIGGLNGGTDLTPMRTRPLDTSGWAGKNVWETHDYPFTVTTPEIGNCDVVKINYGLLYGFVLEQGKPQTGPLWVSEFGVDMQGGPNDGLSDEHYLYLTCLVNYLEGNDADWALWAVQGSYYVRNGLIDDEETWGALDKDWVDWRNPNFKGMLGKMWQVTQGPGNSSH
jgi:hypothetical protein